MTPAHQRRLRGGRSVWMPSDRKARYQPLVGRHETSVAIVGGGMTGALVAQAFALAGIAVAVVESGLVGRGSTVASSALLLHEPDLELGQLGLSDVMLWDTERPYHYARWTPDHRLLLGGGDRLIRPGQQRLRQLRTVSRDLREYFEARLPSLATVETNRVWDELFAMTPDGLPYIGPHRRFPRHWFALGYGGNRMTFGFLAARLLLERWQGSHSDDHAPIQSANAEIRVRDP